MDRALNPSEPTLEDAYYLGRAVAANILVAYRPYTQNRELTRYVNRICQTLVINSSQPLLFKGYYVMILDSPEFNAFASPGGHIFLTRGLVEATTSEDMLAAVIAHELAHIILKHGLSMISDMSLSNEMSATAGRAADFSGNSPAAQRLMGFRSSVTSIIDTMMKNGYSQPQEYAADREAAAILVASGYDPQALVDMLRVLQRVQGSQTGGFNTTHPTPAQRIANVEGLVRQYRIQDTRSYRVPRFRNSR
jgi:predicted Zn-dependent protease